MRILVIAPFYLPYNNPRAHRWGVITQAWAAAGHEVHVLTSVGSKDAKNVQLPNIVIHRVGYNAPKEFVNRWSGSEVAQSGGNSESIFSKLFYWMQNNILEKVYWPDSAFIWYFSAKKAVKKLLSEHQFDGIVSVALPFTAHLVGLAAHKITPNIPWVADMGDPFSLHTHWKINNHFLYDGLNKRAENSILAACSILTVTNDATKKRYINQFHKHTDKIKTIYPILSEGIEKTYKLPPIALPKNKIHIGFFGNFYKDIRSPEGLFALLRAAQKQQPDLSQRLEIHLAGDTHRSFKHLFGIYADVMPLLRLYGMLPRAEALHLSASMNQLLLIGFTNDYQLPSKTVDYLYAAKPVVNICYFADEPFRMLFGQQAPVCHILLPPNHAVGTKQVTQFLDFLRTENHASPEQRADFLARFGTQAIAQQYLNLLLRLD